jgi:hypothetical protein
MLTITVKGDLERRIRATAKKQGQEADSYAVSALERVITEDTDKDEWADFHQAVQKAREGRVDNADSTYPKETLQAMREGNDLFDAYLQAARRGEALPGEEE